jgi:hypothetical protein
MARRETATATAIATVLSLNPCAVTTGKNKSITAAIYTDRGINILSKPMLALMQKHRYLEVSPKS